MFGKLLKTAARAAESYEQQQHKQQQQQGRRDEPAAGAPPPGPSYGAPPPGPAYGAPPPGPAYGAPPSGPTYGAPPSGPAYGAPPSGPTYGAPPSGPAYGAPPSGPAYGGAPPSGPTYGAPPPSGAPPGAAPTSGTQDPPVALSQCNGNRKALFIGINYTGSKAELRGCLNDVKNISSFILPRYNFRQENTRFLTDDQQGANRPTRDNILAGFDWLVAGAQAGDSLFLHYSGHGGTAKDETGDEASGYDQTIIPVDYETAGQIMDDDLNSRLVQKLPKGVRLTAVFDSCHSGSVLDLPYTYNIDGSLQITMIDNRAEAAKAALAAGVAYFQGDKATAMKKGMESFGFVFKELTGPKKATTSKAQQVTEQTRSAVADVIQFSGCRDEQTSADAQINNQFTGALSFAFRESLTQNPNQNYTDLLKSLRTVMTQRQFSQVPQMSTGYKMNMAQPFIM